MLPRAGRGAGDDLIGSYHRCGICRTLIERHDQHEMFDNDAAICPNLSLPQL
jgi:hypothetical protein